MRILNHIINIIFPSACRQCGGPVSPDAATACFCNRCWDDIKWFDGPGCPKCGLPYPVMDAADEGSERPFSPGYLCGDCCKIPPYFDKAVSAGPYEGVLSEAIKLFKYKKKVHVGKALAGCSPLLQKLERGDFLIPVPLHPKRLREREFNQSAIIAYELGNRLRIEVLMDVLIRSRHTRPQVELNMKERGENVIGAFNVRNGDVIGGKEVMLVDDVYTTGSTLNECAKVLKQHGAGKVYAVTIARMTG